ncbi:RidA family protein [Bartonella sp. DGB2]|uniref:RidA family protein n=1 Tax=Bartonella sp. DGB2 TaxID=3388426 RepID=UPI00398F994F
MSDTIETRLQALSLTLPEAAQPVANYISAAHFGSFVFISGQLPAIDGKLVASGKVGDSVTPEEAKKAAEVCALNILAQAKALLGDLSKIKKVAKITVFVAADPNFTNIPTVANGASDLFVNLLGEAGKHTRSAVGVAVLPLDAPVEVEAILEI